MHIARLEYRIHLFPPPVAAVFCCEKNHKALFCSFFAQVTRGPARVSASKCGLVAPHGQGGRRRRQSSVLTAHYIIWAAARAGTQKRMGHLMSRVDGLRHRTYYSSNSTTHFMGRGTGRPVKIRGPPHRLGRAAHIKSASHGQRPGPAHQISS